MALGTPVAAAVAYSAQNGTSVSPAYPTGILATDVVLLITGQKPSTANGGTVTTPNGWTLREEILAQGGYGTTLAAGTGNTNLRIYSWNTPVAGQTGNLAVTLGTNNVSWAFMVRIPKGAGAAQFGSADGSRATAPTANTPFTVNLTNGATATDFQSGDLAIWAMCIPDPASTPTQFSAHSATATGATFATAVEFNEPDSTAGNDIAGFSAYASVSSGSSTAAPSITVTAGGTVTNVRGPIAMVRVREAPATQTLTPTLYTNTQTFQNPTVTASNTLTPALYTNDQTFYGPDVTQAGNAQDLTPGLYTNAQTFYGPTATASNTLTPGLYSNDPTFYSATVSASYALTATRVDNAQTFYGPSVTSVRTLAPALYSNDQTFYSATSSTSNALTATRVDNAQSFFAPTLAVGAVSLAPTLFSNDQTFYAPTLTQGGVVLQPGLFSNEQAFYGPTVTTVSTLAPTPFSNAQTFYGPTVTSVTTLAPALYSNDQTFYAPTLTQGAVVLQPGLYTNAQSFFAPTVAAGAVGLAPELLTNTQSFYAPTVDAAAYVLAPDLLVNAQSFYAPTVTPGPVTLAPQGYVDDGYTDPGYTGPNTFSTPVFYGATVGLTIKPSLYTSTSQFYAPTITVTFLYPDPADVRAGVTYGPGGIYTGTLQSGTVYLRRR